MFSALDATQSTKTKVAALVRFLEASSEKDRIWGVGLLYGKRPKRAINSRQLREWTLERTELPEWLFEECYQVVGDLAETIARVLPKAEKTDERELSQWMGELLELRSAEEAEKKAFVLDAWARLNGTERLVFNKLLTGGFRLGVSQNLMVRALAVFTQREPSDIAFCLTGQWSPWTHSLSELLDSGTGSGDASKPYPFYLAHPLTEEVSALGSIDDWQLEHKWDGIRAQLIVRAGQLFLWSRGEELITERFPEFSALVDVLPEGTVLDGELLAYKDDILPFQKLQTRIGRKKVGKKLLAEAPCVLRLYDLLEWKGKDLRSEPLEKRRQLLEQLVAEHRNPALQLSPVLQPNSWEEAAEERHGSRAVHSEGLMLKRKVAPYEQGRKRGNWWKWKVDPLHIDAVMIYAMRGHGQRSNLYTDYTFAVWKGRELVPFTKAYSGLSMEEFREVDRFVKKHTRERFGPVRSVAPELVFELAFEGIQASSRHKSGIALRFPRMARWRKDKPAEEAGTIEELQELLQQFGS